MGRLLWGNNSPDLEMSEASAGKYFVVAFLSVLLIVGFSFDVFAAESLFTLPDTGQTLCYDQVGGVISCPSSPNALAQDGSYVRHPKSYTVIGSNSDMVQDNNTGLIWQLQDDSSTYNWYEATGASNDTYNSGAVDVCGSLTLGGFLDWRLPTRRELITIVDYSMPYSGPTVNALFINTAVSGYWTSSLYAGNALMAWGIGFGDTKVDPNGPDIYGGDVYADYLDSVAYVRCVRGTAYPQNNYVDNGSTITDLMTGLIWQKQDDNVKRMWAEALAYCESLSLAGQSGWRLPNVMEFDSIIDDTKPSISIDSLFIIGDLLSPFYWTSTTTSGLTSSAWDVDFFDGNIHGYAKDGADGADYTRCVQTGAYLNIALSGQGSIRSDPTGINCGTSCSFPFLKGSVISFSALPTGEPVFSGWSGDAGCDNSLTLNSDMNCTALFNSCGTEIAQVGGTSYSSIMNAYSAAAANPETIKVVATKRLEPLDFNSVEPKNIILAGGYDCLFSNPSLSYTVVDGSFTVSTGSVEVDRLIIMNP